MPSPRSRSRRGLALAVAGVVALALSGCVGAQGTTPTPSPAESPSPVFASDEEALAAAMRAYEAYSAASQEIAVEGGVHPERIDSTVTPAYAAVLHEEFAALTQAGVTLVGPTRVDAAKLSESTYDERGARISVYFCRDVSEVRVIGVDGSDVTPADRDNRVPTQAFFVSSDDDAATILVDGVELWPGEDFC
jgi:hypothetical protein